MILKPLVGVPKVFWSTHSRTMVNVMEAVVRVNAPVVVGHLRSIK
jgi:hypothetical protein